MSLLASASLGLAALAVGLGTSPATAARADVSSAVSVTGAGGYLAPYYTAGDLTGDHQITSADLALVAAGLGTTSSASGWSALAPADYDANGQITLTDLTAMSSRVLYDDGSLDLVEASALDLQKAMNAGVVTSVQLTREYLARIKAYDTTLVDSSTGGRVLNSIISTGGLALQAAAESDAYRAAHGGPRSMLDGIPILLKDNYDTKDLPTSAGHGSWAANQTSDDAFMVQGLRSKGAVVLGKASLDEFAYGFASEFTTLSAAGASKLVASPYNTARTAGGSSGGTGAAIAANLGAIGFGTDTGGSIRIPSTYNQLVGIRPTVGLASRDGIVPLALTQDTGGPLARSVSDAAIALDAVVGADPNDPVTADATSHVPASYTSYLDPHALQGKRFGYVTSMIGTNATTVRLFNQAVADLTAQGATVVPLTTTALAPTLAEASGSTNEFKHDLNSYIATHLDPSVKTRTLADIIASGQLVPGRESIYTSRNNITDSAYSTWISSHSAAIAAGQSTATGLMDSNDLDALIYPSGTPYGTQGTNMRLSPNTGMPAITVPMGQATAADATITGAGVNLELLGRDWSEGSLIGMAYSYEQATEHRTTPALYGDVTGDVFTGTGSSETAQPGDGSTVLTAPKTVTAGQTFTVTVDQAAMDDYGYQLSLSYDPSRLRYVAANTTDSGYSSVSTANGSVSLVHTKLGTSPSAKGATQLASVTFTATSTGPASLSVPSLTTVGSTGTTTTSAAVLTAPVEVAPVPAVGTIATTTKVSVRPGQVRSGRKARTTVVVSAPGATPTGTVRIKVAGTVVRRTKPLVDGKVTVRLRFTGTGPARVKAVYLPDPAYAASSDQARARVLRRR